MRKLFKCTCFQMLFLILCMNIASCSETDENDSKNSDLENKQQEENDVDKFSLLTGHWINTCDNDDLTEFISFNINGLGNISYEYSYYPSNEEYEIIATGKYIVNGVQLTAKYNYVSVYTSNGSNTYNGFTNDQNKTITYKIISCNKSLLILEDNNGNIIYFEPQGTNKGDDEEDNNEEDNNQEDNSDEDNKPDSYDKETLTYSIDGETYQMILVEGGSVAPFRIMQTELPPTKNVKFGNHYVGPISSNDEIVIKSEFKRFIDNLREVTGTPFRLPTVDEWILAACAGDLNNNYIYSGSNDINEVAWYKGNSINTLHPLASKKPNALGIYDMTGNYAELCNAGETIDGIDYNINAYACGGSYKDDAADCQIGMKKKCPTSGKIPGTNLMNKNAYDGRHTTIRLVYTVPNKKH